MEEVSTFPPVGLFLVHNLLASLSLLANSIWCYVSLPCKNKSMATSLRSRGCYVLHHIASNKIYVWHSVKTTDLLRKVTKRAVIRLRVWFSRAAVENINEGSESKEF